MTAQYCAPNIGTSMQIHRQFGAIYRYFLAPQHACLFLHAPPKPGHYVTQSTKIFAFHTIKYIVDLFEVIQRIY